MDNRMATQDRDLEAGINYEEESLLNNEEYMTRSDCVAYSIASLLCAAGWAAPNIALQVFLGNWTTRAISFVVIPLSSYGCSIFGGWAGYKAKKAVENACCSNGDEASQPEQLTSFKAPRLRL